MSATVLCSIAAAYLYARGAHTVWICQHGKPVEPISLALFYAALMTFENVMAALLLMIAWAD